MFHSKCMVLRTRAPFSKSYNYLRFLSSKTKENEINKDESKKPNQKALLQPPKPSEDYLKKSDQLDKAFNDRLKQVFVTSKHENTTMNLPEHRPMPQDRSIVSSTLPHSQVVVERTPNKLMVDDIQIILTNNKRDPNKWTAQYIAEQFNIDLNKIEKLLSNYSSLNTFVMDRPNEDNKDLQRREEEIKIRHSTSIWDAERIIVGEGRKKWLTIEEALHLHNLAQPRTAKNDKKDETKK